MVRYLYRAQPGYEKGTSIKCKDPNSDVSLTTHIAYGSKKTKNGELIYKSKYISCTKSCSVAMVYSLGSSEKKHESTRRPVVLIDMEKLAQLRQIYDVSSPEILNKLPNIWARNFAPASKEMVTEIEIPEDCIREMPLICVDMIRALECISGATSEDCQKMIETINDLIMSDDPNFRTAIENLKFDGKMQEFYEMYYKNGKSSIDEVSRELFNGDQELANCVRIQLIKDVFKGTQLGAYVTLQALLTGAVSSKDAQKIAQHIDKEFIDIISPDIHMIKRMRQHEATSKKEKDKEAEHFVNGGLAILINPGQRISIPFGIKFEERDGQLYAIKLKQEIYRTDGHLENPDVIRDRVRQSQPISLLVTSKTREDKKRLEQVLQEQTYGDSEFENNIASLSEEHSKQPIVIKKDEI